MAMIIVKLHSGLGNQLFQYALGRHLAEKNAALLKLDLSSFKSHKVRSYGLHCFKINAEIASQEDIEPFKRMNNSIVTKLISMIRQRLNISHVTKYDLYHNAIVLKEKNFSFNNEVLDTKGNIYLEGYWQSEKYFSNIKNILQKELIFKYEPDARNMEMANIIKNSKSVSLHVRRGDYVHNPANNRIHGLCAMDYYRKAIEFLTSKTKNCHFYIFSDDHTWVRNNFLINYPFTIVDHNDSSKNYEDLRLMSLCCHNIIANSSFSWWGAWLNDNHSKIVLSPKQWFNDPSFDTSDLIPESWIKI